MPVFLRWFLRLGPTNPITVRLVQNGSRRIRHLYIRAAYLAVLIVVLLWTLLIKTSSANLSYRELAAAGSASFEFIAYLQIGLICVLAPVFMAGAIAQEASPRTWEVLLTTPLTAIQIVLGNLLGRLFFIIALLAASLPLFAITQYFGGVPGSSIMLSYLIAGTAALVVGTIAIALSVSRLAGRRAVFAFYVSVISYLAVTLAIDRLTTGSVMPGVKVTYVTAVNPFLALYALLNPSTYTAAPAGSLSGIKAWLLEKPVTTWCVTSSILSCVLILGSGFTVRAGGLATLTSDSGGIPWYRRLFGLAAAGSEHRAPRSVWVNPVAWREATARNATLGRIIARWSFITLGGLFGLAMIILYHTGYFGTGGPTTASGAALPHETFRQILMYTVWGEIAVIALVAVNMAATAVSREREDGTLDLLLTTPITPGSYLWGKLRGLTAYLLPLLAVPLGTLIVAGIYVLFDGLSRPGGIMVSQPVGTAVITSPVVLPEAALTAPLMVIPFIAFCVMVGLQRSLGSKGTIGSVVATVGIVGIFAGIAGLCAFKAASSIPFLGPILAALSPGVGLFANIDPAHAMLDTTTGATGLSSARTALAIGSLVAAGVYIGVMYGIHANMVRTFDTTVRKLAGVK